MRKLGEARAQAHKLSQVGDPALGLHMDLRLLSTLRLYGFGLSRTVGVVLIAKEHPPQRAVEEHVLAGIGHGTLDLARLGVVYEREHRFLLFVAFVVEKVLLLVVVVVQVFVQLFRLRWPLTRGDEWCRLFRRIGLSPDDAILFCSCCLLYGRSRPLFFAGNLFRKLAHDGLAFDRRRRSDGVCSAFEKKPLGAKSRGMDEHDVAAD